MGICMSCEHDDGCHDHYYDQYHAKKGCHYVRDDNCPTSNNNHNTNHNNTRCSGYTTTTTTKRVVLPPNPYYPAAVNPADDRYYGYTSYPPPTQLPSRMQPYSSV